MIPIEAALKTIAAAIPGTLGGAIAGYLVNRRMESVRRGLRLREEHLQKLKQDVLQVLLNQTTGYYGPICEKELGGIVSWPTQILKQPESVVDQSYVRTEYKLRVRPILPRSDDMFGRSPSPALHSPNFDHYYPDARENHFRELLKDWEMFRGSVESTLQKHLGLTETLAKDLQSLLKVPPRLASHSEDKIWANYETLAVFLFEHGLGISQFHLYIQNHSQDVNTRICFSGSQEQVVQGSDPAQTKELLSAITQASKGLAASLPELSNAYEELRPRGKQLAQRLLQAINSNQLPKACAFTSE